MFLGLGILVGMRGVSLVVDRRLGSAPSRASFRAIPTMVGLAGSSSGRIDMAARAIASTTVSFGLVSLPVKLYSTGEPGARISFNLLHEACGTRLKQQYVCPKCDVIVSRE